MYNYLCFNSKNRNRCDSCSSTGQVLSEKKCRPRCPFTDNPLKLMGEIYAGGIIGLRKEQNLKQRRQRNRNHFIKYDLPDVTDPDVKRHHLKKLGRN